MNSAPRRWPFLAGVLLMTALTVRAQTPSKTAEGTPPAKEPASGPSPAGKLEDALDQLDQARKEIAQLKKQLNAEKPDFRGSCKLSGRVDGDVVRLKADFEFKTLRPRETVALGCQKAQLSAAVLDDGRLPVLPPPGDDGFVVQVETPGQHRLSLEMELPITSRGRERSFDLSLPRAAINILEQLDVPGALPDIRILSVEDKRQFQQVVQAGQISSKNEQRKALPLGAVARLEVSWKVPAPPPTGEPVREVRGEVEVRVDEHYVTTKADLTLRLRSGQTDQWRVLAPAGATLEVKGLVDEKPPTIIAPTDQKNPIWLIKREPSNKPLQLVVGIRQQRMNKLVPLGPFAVLGAERQSGTITVSSSPADVRLRYHTRGDISQTEIPEERRQDSTVVASFNYYNLPMPQRPNQPVQGPLDLEIEAVKGAVESRVFHNLLLTRQDNKPCWRLISRIEITPVRTAVERFDVELPIGLRDVKASPAGLVEDLTINELAAQRRVATIKLVQKQPSNRTFTVTLEGLYSLPADAEQAPVGQPRRLALALPYPVDTTDRGGEVTAAVREGLELIAPESGSDAARPGPRPHTWRTDRAPGQVELSWREHRPDLSVQGEIELTLTDRQALVRQQLRFAAPPAFVAGTLPRAPFLLRVPSALAGRVTVGEGYPLAPHNEARTVWAVTLPELADRDHPTRKEYTLTLDYAYPLPEPDADTGYRRFALVWPEQATGGMTKVWVASDPDVRVLPVRDVGERWDKLQSEPLPSQQERTAALVLRSSSLEMPVLTLNLLPAEAPPTVVKRVLIQATVDDWGHQTYRARFLLTRVTGRTLDVELPAPPSAINLALLLGDQRVPMRTIDEKGQDAEQGRIVRLDLDPAQYARPVVLDLQYQLVMGRGTDRGGPLGNWRVRTGFQPPAVRGKVFVWETRWQLRLPGGWVPLSAGEGSRAEQSWGWRGWLMGPRSAVSSEGLENWFSTGVESPGSDPTEPGLVCRQTTLEPLQLVHVPQQAWLLVCSLTIFALGFVLYFVSLSPAQFWSLAAALGVTVVLAGILWPGVLLAVVYGGEPGLLVLLLVFGFAWMRQRRYRRQLVFMPGFSRLQAAGSSLVRSKGSKSGSNRPQREPSTVDVAPAGGGGK